MRTVTILLAAGAVAGAAAAAAAASKRLARPVPDAAAAMDRWPVVPRKPVQSG